ncbi:hypothetical protein EV426DRAFT_642063 [Tirmania nivea]|nr:hypothetical protein EV426DRAFT_642063 [Tirmania nivea]
MSQHPQLVGPTSEPPRYSPRIIDYPAPDPELPPVELRTLQRPPPAYLPDQQLGDEESNVYHDESHACPPSYTPPHRKDDAEVEIIFTPRSPPKARSSSCTRRCCVFVFFIIIIVVGVPLGYTMAKRAQFNMQEAARRKLGS